MEEIVVQDVWFAEFPKEENPDQTLIRPVIVLHVYDDTMEVLSIKVTKHEARNSDEFDTGIFYWEDAYLRYPSIARISKTRPLLKSAFKTKIGTLHPQDWENITKKFEEWMNEQ